MPVTGWRFDTSAAGSYAAATMWRPRRPGARPPEVDPISADLDPVDPGTLDADPDRLPEAIGGSGEPDLAGLPIAGLTRRRMLFLTTTFVSVWIVIAFTRQVGDAAAATARADALRTGNVELQSHVDALQRELSLIQKQAYVVQQARGVGLGSTSEIRFSLEAGAPSLAPDAPGSAAVRVGAVDDRTTPLESWLALLFGPGDGPGD